MRLWTLHPRYLDGKGLVALWREALLAQKVLGGMTRGYRHHPQLARFRDLDDPVGTIGAYLAGVLAESRLRGYRFDRSKIIRTLDALRLQETQGQLQYEWRHLLHKLAHRSPDRYRKLASLTRPEPHPLFRIVPGPVQPWERERAAV